MSRISTEKLNSFASSVTDLYRSMEVEILRQIATTLKRTGEVNITEWQQDALREFGNINRSTIRMVAENAGVSVPVINEALREFLTDAIFDVDTALGTIRSVPPLSQNLDRIVTSFKNQIFLNMDNFVNQTLISTNYGHGMLMRMYQDVINKTTLNFTVGNMTFHQALERTILEWSEKGIQSTFVDRGGHLWSMERYVDIVLKSIFNRTYNDLRTARMAEFDVHTVLMSSLMDAADRCVHCQGQVLDMRPIGQNVSGYPSIYEFGYGEPGGTLGINCRHQIWPFIPGVNTNNQPQFDTEDSVEKSKVRQRQRELERRIRATKKRAIVQEELESPNLERTMKTLKRQQAEMRELLSDADWLRRQPGNERVYTPRHLLIEEFKRNPSGDFGERGYGERWEN